MKKKGLLFLFLLVASLTSLAHHIAGGELLYTYTGVSNGNYQYTVTVKLYRHCDADRNFDNSIVVSVFNRGSNSRVTDYTVSLTKRETESLTNPNPCITNPPSICLEVAYYTFTVSLPGVAEGYVLATQANYRAEDMANLTNGYSNVGATYTAEIPGTSSVSNGPVNNSAQFIGSDLEVLCIGNHFSYSFAAKDADGDQLRYSFCNGYNTSGGGANVSQVSPPPYSSLPYGNGYTGTTPLGASVQINSSTGLITGTAPSSGTYVIAVCVEELRNGVVIATQHKDIQVNTSSCTLAAAELLPNYKLCKASYSISIANQSTSTLINSYKWTLTNQSGRVVYNTTNKTFDYTFADTGTYALKLNVATSNGCEDSTSTSVLVYPGFAPGFTVAGSCYQSPFQFTDTTKAPYDYAAAWNWRFGDNNTATTQNPSHQYSTTGSYTVSLVVSSNKGCVDTVTKTITVFDKPDLFLPFHDTLICSIDTLPLMANGTGIFSWSPNANMINSNTGSPLVYPKDTTTYVVTLTDHSCVAQDSIKVNVLDFITVALPTDTTICKGDSIVLRPRSDALSYSWTPAASLNNAFTKYPSASPAQTTLYTVDANLGKCQASASTLVKVVPYPQAMAGLDTTICYGGTAQLQGSIVGSSFSWSPLSTLNNATTLSPTAAPLSTTTYVLAAYDTLGCPKPFFDSVTVMVLPKIEANAGRDTAVIINQPLQLSASGGITYLWTPATGLSSTMVANPIATLGAGIDSITYTVRVFNSLGCYADDAIAVKIFKTGPEIFVLSAFTPNGDGRNDVIRPILVGMRSLAYFRVYNRWGQLIFSTTDTGKGWDGAIRGTSQQSDVFVYIAEGTTYLGAKIFRKGTFTLIR